MNIRSILLCAIALIAVLVTFSFVEPVSQDPGYHNFADNRTFWGIPNTLDVLSNIAHSNPDIRIFLLGYF